MKIKREELLNQVSSVRPGLSQREMIEQSSCVVFKDGMMITFNDEVACSLPSCLDIEGAVVAEPLIKILTKLKEEFIEITVEKTEIHIQAGKKKKVGISMDAEIQLPIDAMEIPKKWKKLPDDFADAVHLVKRCAGTKETEFVMTCIHIHPKWMEACDNYQVGRYKMKMDIKNPELVRKYSLSFIES